MKLTGVCNTSDRAVSHSIISQASEAPVLSGSQVHHPASVVGLLVHQPVAVHHVAGLAIRHVVTVHDVVAVLHQLMHLTTEVLPLVDPYSIGPFVLLTDHLNIMWLVILIRTWILWAIMWDMWFFVSLEIWISYHGDHTTRPDAVTKTHHALIVRILPSLKEVLLTHVVGTVINHETATLHLAGVAPAQVGGHVCTVAAGLIGATLEVPVLVEDDLESNSKVKV